jgi:hypothetical protein
MATDAGERIMRAGQCVATRLLMVVFGVGPLRFTMTVGATAPKIAKMLIVLEVAGNAFGSRLMKRFGFSVAVEADRFEMTVTQWKASQVMIERLLDKTEHIGVAPFVIGVTGGALTLADVRRQTMKTRNCLDIGRDLGVTVKAQRALGFARKTRMARSAFRLVFGVIGNYRTGINKSLKDLELSTDCHAGPPKRH